MGLFSLKISNKKMERVKELLRQAGEYADAANKAVKPEVFFDRYDKLEASLRELSDYEKYKVFRGNTPSRDLLRTQEQRQDNVNAMIQRSFLHAKEQAKRAGQPLNGAVMQEYFGHLETFSDNMNRFNQKVAADLKKITLDSQRNEMVQTDENNKETIE